MPNIYGCGRGMLGKGEDVTGMWNIDASSKYADWTKRTWDLDSLRRIAERLRRQQERRPRWSQGG